MLKLNDYIIIENKKEWDKDYSEKYNTFRGHAYDKKPIKFPCAYYYETPDYGTNGPIKAISLEGAIENMKALCKEEIIWYLSYIKRLREIQYGKN